MSLDKYAAKRKFDKTPEPAGAVAPAGGRMYCVQRHHARHLHYDLRLEVNGTLKSWAVPKGPTLDPAEKRLAMMVEDHPIEYGSFEGIIPAGNYGAGSVMLWDRGTYELLGDATAETQLERGDFKFRLHGEKVRGEFALVRTKRGKGNEWLLIKKKDAEAQPGWSPEDHERSILTGRTQAEIAGNLPAAATHSTTPLPSITPMLAEIGTGDPPTGPGAEKDWTFEVKWDGVRAICYLDHGRLRMESRRGNNIDRQYPELSILPHHINATTAILDAEIAALDERGVPSFERLQQRINVGDASAIATLTRHVPVVMYVFDLLYLNGRDLRGERLEERKRLLREILKPSATIRYSEEFTDGHALLEAARAQGIEGIVAKRRRSFYESRRTSDWIKYKVTSSDSFIICGILDGEREYISSLILGVYDGAKLVWAGNVGTGWDTKTEKMLHAKLMPLAIEDRPVQPDKNLPKKGVTWLRPELVCEVKYTNWTQDGRLRAPVYLGLRPDIDPSDCIKPGSQRSERKQLLDSAKQEAVLTIDGHDLKFTNLPKVFYPAEGYTKRDLLNYYDAVAPLLVPHLKDRPLSLKRYPNGIAEDFFFQKEVAPSFPKWLRKEVAGDGIRYVIGEDRATLLYLVNLGCIDHNPWMSRMQSQEHPDYVLIDLDPHECSFDKIVEAALLLRKYLDKAELESYPKTTGGDGMHVIVPIAPEYTFEQVRGFAELLSALVIHERPALFTTPRSVAKRQKGRVYFDWQQIASGKTISSPYSVRAYPKAPVATPLHWREVTPRLHPHQFTIATVLSRFDRLGDVFAPVLAGTQRLEHAVERLS